MERYKKNPRFLLSLPLKQAAAAAAAATIFESVLLERGCFCITGNKAPKTLCVSFCRPSTPKPPPLRLDVGRGVPSSCSLASDWKGKATLAEHLRQSRVYREFGKKGEDAGLFFFFN